MLFIKLINQQYFIFNGFIIQYFLRMSKLKNDENIENKKPKSLKRQNVSDPIIILDDKPHHKTNNTNKKSRPQTSSSSNNDQDIDPKFSFRKSSSGSSILIQKNVNKSDLPIQKQTSLEKKSIKS